MDYQKYIPAVIIGLVVIYALSKLKGSSSPQVYNALLPSSTDRPENRDAARTEGFSTLASVGLGQLKLSGEKDQALLAVDLAKQRFANTIDLAKIQQQGATDRLLAQFTDRAYDRALQERALDQSFALAQTGQVTGGLGQLTAGILSAIRPSQQSRPSGSSSPSVGSPPLNPNANRVPVRRGSMSVVTDWLSNYFNAPVSVPDYPSLGYVQQQDFYDWSFPWNFGDSQDVLTNADMLIGIGSYPIIGGGSWTDQNEEDFFLDPWGFYN